MDFIIGLNKKYIYIYINKHGKYIQVSFLQAAAVGEHYLNGVGLRVER